MSVDDVLRRAATEVREVTSSAPPPELGRSQRRPRLVALGVGLATAIVAAVIAVFALNGGRTVVSVGPPSTAANPLADPTSRNLITMRLNIYMQAVNAGDLAGAMQAGHPNWWQGSTNTGPVLDDGQVIAVAAFSWDPRGPVLVVSYYGGQWHPAAYLPDPWCPCQGFTPEPSTIDLRTPIQVGDVTGDGRPDFLISMTAAGTTPGAVLTQDGAAPGNWRYAPFSGPFPTATKVGGSPTIQGDHIVSIYNNCDPACAQGQQWPISWSYQRATGEFSAPPSDANPPRSRIGTTDRLEFCRTDQLTASAYQGSGQVGHEGTVVVLTNTSKVPCVIYGYPTAWFLDTAGARISATTTPQDTPPPTTVELAPGGQAATTIWTTNPGVPAASYCQPTRTSAIEVVTPGRNADVKATISVTVCGQHNDVGVTPIRSGTSQEPF